MKKILIAVIIVVLALIIPACTSVQKPEDVAVILKEPPVVPPFVNECRAFITENTGEAATSDRANFYCGCIADLGLHLTQGWELQVNVSEQQALQSMCLSDSYIVYPAVNIENR